MSHHDPPPMSSYLLPDLRHCPLPDARQRPYARRVIGSWRYMCRLWRLWELPPANWNHLRKASAAEQKTPACPSLSHARLQISVGEQKKWVSGPKLGFRLPTVSTYEILWKWHQFSHTVGIKPSFLGNPNIPVLLVLCILYICVCDMCVYVCMYVCVYIYIYIICVYTPLSPHWILLFV